MPAVLITVTGNLVADPELRNTANGKVVANFGIAHTPRVKVSEGVYEDGETLFLRCTVWGRLAENVKKSLIKGNPVLVTGRMSLRTYENAAGMPGLSHDLDVDSVGADLRWATATITRNAPASSSPVGAFATV